MTPLDPEDRILATIIIIYGLVCAVVGFAIGVTV